MFCWKVSICKNRHYDKMFLFTVMYRLKLFTLSLFTTCKLGCVVRMVIASILPHAESGPNDNRKDAPPFKQNLSFEWISQDMNLIFFKESWSFRFSFRSMLGQFNNLTSIKFSMVEINLLVLHGFSIWDPCMSHINYII